RFQSAGRRGWDHWFGAEVFGLEQVEAVLTATGYPKDSLHFVAGPVEETLPAAAPGQIAVLRLDTDWYESTRHELEHLYPDLTPGGVLLVDDYGHWEGARRAVARSTRAKASGLSLTWQWESSRPTSASGRSRISSRRKNATSGSGTPTHVFMPLSNGASSSMLNSNPSDSGRERSFWRRLAM